MKHSMKTTTTNFNQQINILMSRGMIINNFTSAKNFLRAKNYYNLINGTKEFIIDKSETTKETYKNGLTFEEVVSIYEFGEHIRSLFLKYILIIENELRTHIAYEFSKAYSSTSWNNKKCFKSKLGKKGFSTLQKSINDSIHYDTKKNTASDSKENFVLNAKANNKDIPLWSLVNFFTFGTLKTFYFSLKYNLANSLPFRYYSVSKKTFVSFLETLNMFRNVLAHDYRLFFYRIIDENKKIVNSPIHYQLNIRKNSLGEYEKGKGDLFAVVIIFKYLLSEKDFSRFVKRLKGYFCALRSKLKVVTLDEIYDSLGFPHNTNGEKNWKTILKMSK